MGSPKICILRIEGTNCEYETYLAFKRLGADPSLVHIKQFKDPFDYHCIIIPGGFSAGDYVRAGAIFATRLSNLKEKLREYTEQGYPIAGICNGFQVLVELGFLPDLHTYPQAALITNISGRFECRSSLVKHENPCAFTKNISVGKILELTSAHAEGRFLLKEADLQRLIDNKQIVFRYVDTQGRYAGYPWNPNGSVYNIAGICNPTGNVFGIMPHPERRFFGYQHQIPHRKKGDGRYIFESVIDYILHL